MNTNSKVRRGCTTALALLGALAIGMTGCTTKSDHVGFDTAEAAVAALVHPAAALLALVQPGSDDRPGACREALAEYRPIAAGVESSRRTPSRDAPPPGGR